MNEEAAAKVEEFAAEAQKTMEEGVEKMTKSMETVAEFGQQNLDAMVESSRAAVKVAETINAELMAFSKKTYQDSFAAAKELTSCTSMTEFVEKQVAFNKTVVDGMMAEASKMNELCASGAKDCFDPLTARMHATVDYVKSLGA
ncbi:MAG: phasin family protein [Pseudomonadota bacterium]